MAGTASPTVDVFIRSYHRDRAWLALALRAVARYLRGHRRVVVVVPRSSAGRMGDIDNATVACCEDYADDYLGQQITKLHADLYTNADVILHLDSDHVLVAPCDVRQLFDAARLRMDYRAEGNRPVTDGWRRAALAFFGDEPPWDLTGPPPLAVPRELYAGLRAFCLLHHGCTLAGYALRQGADRFCEFALLRGYALRFGGDLCAWTEGPLLPQCRTFWSRRETPASIAAQLPAALTQGSWTSPSP
jgi:hypothetical protein